MSRAKGVVEKAVDAIDSLIHSQDDEKESKATESKADAQESKQVSKKETSHGPTPFANHPKFAKFETGVK